MPHESLVTWRLAGAFPFPVALAYQNFVSTQRTRARPERALVQLLTCSEALLQLVGSAVLVEAAEAVGADAGLRKRIDGVRLQRAGLGTWLTAIERLGGVAPKPFLTELAALRADPPAWGEFLDALKVVADGRNGVSHPFSLPEGEDAQERLDMLEAAFKTVARHLDWLCRYSLVGVTESYAKNQAVVSLSLRFLTGSTGSMDLTQLEAGQRGLREGDVLLLAPKGDRAIILTPFYALADDDDLRQGLQAWLRQEARGGPMVAYACGRPSRKIEPWTLVRREPGLIEEGLGGFLTRRGRAQERRTLRVDLGLSAHELQRLQRRTPDTGTLAGLDLADLEFYREGGMAHVYLGRSVSSDERRILKVEKHPQAGRRARTRFEREAKLLERLNHHNIIRVIRLDRTQDGRRAMVEDFFDAPSLQEALDSSGPFPLETVQLIAEELLDGVGYLHRQAVIHRDLKPSNILFRRDASPSLKIIDLGVAKDQDDHGSRTTTRMLGTQLYMSPEQRINGDITPATDIYGLGLTLYTLLHGSPSRPDEHNRHTLDSESVPPAVAEVLRRCCEPSAGERYANVPELQDALNAAWTGERPSSATETSQKPVDTVDRGAIADAYRREVDDLQRQLFITIDGYLQAAIGELGRHMNGLNQHVDTRHGELGVWPDYRRFAKECEHACGVADQRVGDVVRELEVQVQRSLEELEVELSALRDRTLRELTLHTGGSEGSRERVVEEFRSVHAGAGLVEGSEPDWETPGAEARRAVGVGSVFAGVGIIAGPLGFALGSVVGTAVTSVAQLIKRKARAKAVRDHVVKHVSEAHARQVNDMRHWALEIQRQVSMRVQASANAYERVIRGASGG